MARWVTERENVCKSVVNERLWHKQGGRGLIAEIVLDIPMSAEVCTQYSHTDNVWFSCKIPRHGLTCLNICFLIGGPIWEGCGIFSVELGLRKYLTGREGLESL